MKSSVRLKLEGAAWLGAWRVSRALPERWVVRAFERASMRSYRRNERRRAQVRANLEPVVAPEVLDRAVEDAFRWYGRYWAETFRMPDIPEAEFESRFRVHGREHIDNAIAGGKGAVFATLHQGNWDAGGRWAGARWGLTVVVEVLRPPALFKKFVEHREALGMRIIPLARGGDATARCIAELEEGRLLALVADRDLTGKGITVKMFGRTTKIARGPAVLALRTGAPLIPATIFQRPDGSWDGKVLPPLPLDSGDIETVTQELARAYESFIRDEPTQWHMFSPYWTDA